MNLLDIIKTRRSIRKFTEKEISDQQIDEILTAAMYAPSAANQQPWHFIVVRNKETFQKIQTFHPFSQMLSQANVAILVCGDSALETKQGYWPIDCGAATQNILLSAHGLGLGAVWLGIYPVHERQQGITDLFSLPENVHPFSLIAMGYPAEEKKLPERFKPERIHFEKW